MELENINALFRNSVDSKRRRAFAPTNDAFIIVVL